MSIFITACVYFINCILGILKNNTKIIACSLGIIMLVLMCFVPSNIPDNYVYQSAYYSGVGRFEWGYSALSSLSLKCGLNFVSFRAILLAFSFFILYYSLQKYTDNMSYVLCLYFIFPFFMDIIQIRNFVMLTLVILASTFMFKKSAKNFVIASLLIVLAASFHTLGYVYIIAVILLYFSNNKLMYIFGALLAGLGLLSIFIPLGSQIQAVISFFTGNGYMGAYIDNYISSGNGESALNYTIVHFILLFYVMFNFRYAKKQLGASNPITMKQNVIFKFVIATLIAMPIYQIDSSFFRIVRDIFLLVICSSVLTIKILKGDGNKIIYSSSFLVVVLVAYWLFIKPVIFENTIKLIFGY